MQSRFFRECQSSWSSGKCERGGEKGAESVEQYPDALCRDLTRALSEKEQLPEENILFANGAAELIFALTQALRPKKALIAAPGFAEYEAALSAAGCFIRMYPLQKEKGFLLQDDFCDDLTDDLDLVFYVIQIIQPALRFRRSFF